MQYILNAPKRFNSTIELPPSKSISNRALVIHALSQGGEFPSNLSECDDTRVIIDALENGLPDTIDIKAAGTAMRFLTAYLSVVGGTHTLTGTERMQHRPIKILVDALRHLGAQIEYLGEEGFPPLRITGCDIEGGELAIPGSMSSQYISALLMIAPYLKKGLKLKLTDCVVSRPYIDLTLWTMAEYGAKAEWSDIDTISVEPQPYKERNYLIENDWSAASYWYEMVALNDDPETEITLTGLIDGSKQGDSMVRYIFSLLGVRTFFEKKGTNKPTSVTLKRTRRSVPKLEYDFVSCPDLAQTFVVCCALMNVPFRFKGLSTLKYKETDRIEALKKELRKMGYVIRDIDDCELVWEGERCEPDGEIVIDTYEDHRMALAFAPAAMRFPGMKINEPQVVTKSYPRFWEDLRRVGFDISEC